MAECWATDSAEEGAARRRCTRQQADGSENESGGLMAAKRKEKYKGRRLERVLESFDAGRGVEVRSFERGKEAFRGVVAGGGDDGDGKGDDDDTNCVRRKTEECIKRHAERCIEEGKVVLRNGWERLFEGTLSGPSSPGKMTNIDRIGIISVGWSPVWIKACIAAAWAQSSKGNGSTKGSSNMEGIYDVVDKRVDVYCNDVLDDAAGPDLVDGRGPGSSSSFSGFSSSAISSKPTKASSTDIEASKTVAGIFTASDKLDAMKAMLHSWGSASPVSFDDAKKQVLYFGDSPTDIGCLLADGVTGICMRDSDPWECLSLGQHGGHAPIVASETEQDTLLALLVEEVGVDVGHVQDVEPALAQRMDLNDRSDDGPNARKLRSGSPDGKEQCIGQKFVYWARDFKEVLESDILGAC